MTLLLILLAPAAASLAAILLPRGHRATGPLVVSLNLVSLAASAWMSVAVAGGRTFSAADGFWRVDALSALMALCITAVATLAAASPPLPEDGYDQGQIRRFRIYVSVFTLMMLVAVTTHNVGIMWVAIEATTITSAIVIPLHRTKSSVEASWKYLLICSVGIVLAFAGTLLAYFDFVSTAGHVPDALDWTVLRAAAASMHPELMQLAFAFLLVGYGTKAGLAPMHTWLPDAHSEAPAAMSAMMSGVLLAVAMYAVARWKSVVDLAAPGFASDLLLAAGLLSLLVGSLSLVIQRHYKRMLAYSSVEHIGLVAVGLGLGPLGSFAAFLHLLNHAAAKSLAFLLAGRILRRYGTTEIDGVTGLMRAMPWTGPLFAAGVLALVGLPPFGLFVSEFLLVRAAVLGRRPVVAAAVLVFVLVAFVSLFHHMNRMLYGPVPEGVTVGETGGFRLAALAGCVVVLVALGVMLPQPLAALLERTVGLLTP